MPLKLRDRWCDVLDFVILVPVFFSLSREPATHVPAHAR